MGKINFEYLAPLEEPLWFALLWARQLLRAKPSQAEGTLIVNVCLVGEFAASVPAMHALMQTINGPVDLLVSPPLIPLARRLRGVRAVYAARSSVARANEAHEGAALPRTYDTIIALRMSADAHRMLGPVTARTVRTGLRAYAAYGLELAAAWARRQTPRAWRQVNFRMVGLPERYPPLEDLFDFKPEEYAAARARLAALGTGKVVLIHTGASWVRNRWPLERWAELLTLLNAHGGYQFAFVGAPKDQADVDALASQLTFPIHSLIGALDLAELLLCLRAADYCIGVDSGPRNLAHLAGTPSVTLLGPAPHMYTPPNPRDRVLDKSGGRHLLERFVVRNGPSLMEQHTAKEVFDEFVALG